MGAEAAMIVPLGGGAWERMDQTRRAHAASTVLPSLGTRIALALWPSEREVDGTPPALDRDAAVAVTTGAEGAAACTDIGLAMAATVATASGEWRCEDAMQPGETLVIAAAGGGRLRVETQRERITVDLAHAAWICVHHPTSAGPTRPSLTKRLIPP